MPSLKSLLSLLPFAVGVLSGSLADYPPDDVDSGKVLSDLSKKAFDNAMKRLEETGTPECNVDNVRIHKEWRKIPGEQRTAYTDAVQCLMNKPGKLSIFEGSKTAFDDFAVLHILLVQYVHVSASFLLFHRYFLHTYSEALGECGYDGPIPYWNWGWDCDDVDASPLFDGSETSLGSNGVPIPDRTEGPIPGLEIDGVPLGTGGGCVHTGPFNNYTVNMGTLMDPDPTRYNPRCLVRDLNPHICRRWASLRNTTQVLVEPPNIELFQAVVQGDPRYEESADLGFGVHGGGHYVVSGDPGSDFLFSPLEPAFYLHHQQIDRLYFVWQNLDWETRQNIAGTRTWLSIPLAQNATLDDVLLFKPLNAKRTLGELINTLGATPFCFVYE